MPKKRLAPEWEEFGRALAEALKDVMANPDAHVESVRRALSRMEREIDATEAERGEAQGPNKNDRRG